MRSHPKIEVIRNRFNKFWYRSAWLHTIHIATTGNDSTGDGSKSNPYKTFSKAINMAVAGDGILAADGTYQENTASLGYWLVQYNFANWVTIEPELGAAGNVVISGTSHSSRNVYLGGAANSYIKFRYVTFTMSSGSTICVSMTYASYIKFEHCTFTPISGGTNGVLIQSAGNNMSNITLSYCKITAPATTGYYGVQLITTGTDTLTNISFSNCDITGSDAANRGGFNTNIVTSCSISITNSTISGGYAILAHGGVFTISGCVFTGTAAATAVAFGDDAVSGGNATTVSLSNSFISKNPALSGHALLIGNGAVNCVVDNVSVTQAYDYAFVVKEHTGTEIKNCHIVGGSSASLYFKAAISPNAHDNVITITTGYGFKLGAGDTGHKNSNYQFQNNVINVSGTGKALAIGTNTDDAGGGVVDYNTYQNNSGLGNVRGDADVQSLAELQAAWADYSVPTNDSHSTVS